MATCVGLFLFTRILIPDVMLTFTIALAMWAFLRALDEDEPHPARWAVMLAASLGVGLLLKSLIGVVFPVARRRHLSAAHPAAVFRQDLEASASVQRSRDRAADCRALARPGDAAQSALLRVHPAQRARPISRLPVVLLHQRAAAALPEPALSARLQHRAAALLLAVPPALAVSLERVLPGGVQAVAIGRWIAPDAPDCWRSAGRDSSWCSSPSPPRRSITRCRAIPALALLLGSAMAMDAAWIRGHARAGCCCGMRGVRPSPSWCGAQCAGPGRYSRAPSATIRRSIRSPWDTWRTSRCSRSPICVCRCALAAVAFVIGAIGASVWRRQQPSWRLR